MDLLTGHKSISSGSESGSMTKSVILLLGISLLSTAFGCGSRVPARTDQNTIRLTSDGSNEPDAEMAAEMRIRRSPYRREQKRKEREAGVEE